jgi:hypothetical protein
MNGTVAKNLLTAVNVCRQGYSAMNEETAFRGYEENSHLHLDWDTVEGLTHVNNKYVKSLFCQSGSTIMVCCLKIENQRDIDLRSHVICCKCYELRNA